METLKKLLIYQAVTLMLLIPLFSMISVGSSDGVSVSISNNGRITASEAASLKFIGSGVEYPGSRAGSFAKLIDEDGDGNDDIFLSAATPSGGGVFCFNQSKGELEGTINIGSHPDSTMYGGSPVTTGDFDGDGIQEVASGGSFTYSSTGKGGGFDISCFSPADQVPYNNLAYAGDLDGDGIDELVGSKVGYNSMNLPDVTKILWSTGNWTTLKTNLTDYFGFSVDCGDIDGDGTMDMVLGIPRNDTAVYEQNDRGSVMIVFNVSRLKDVYTFHPSKYTDVLISGSDPYDRYGWNVKLEDLDGDGREDIIVGAPGADGIYDDKPQCGEIHVIRGKDKRAFTRFMKADPSADIRLIGTESWDEDSEYPGDKLGTMYEIADLDNDGRLDLAVSFSHRHLPNIGITNRRYAGMVACYSFNKVFPSSANFVQLKDDTAFFIIEGEDIRDSLGWQISTGDVNEDGLTDLLISAPVSDGPENSIPFCGEVYLILGKSGMINDILVSGKGVEGRNVFCGLGPLDIEIPFRSRLGPQDISRITLVLGPATSNTCIVIKRESIDVENDPYHAIKLNWTTPIIESSTLDGSWKLSFSIGMLFLHKGPIDIKVRIRLSGEEEIERTFRNRIRIVKDVRLSNEFKLHADGNAMINNGDWLVPGSDVGIHGLKLIYRNFTDRSVDFGQFDMVLYRNKSEISRVGYGKTPPPTFKVLEDTEPEYTVQCEITDRELLDIPAWTLPSIFRKIDLSVHVDLQPPSAPDVQFSGNGGIPGFSRYGDIELATSSRIGIDSDPEGSGVKYITYTINGDDPMVIMERGGLFGTYCIGRDLGIVSFERVDKDITFGENKWGVWGPDPATIPPDDHCVRWHGWIEAPRTGDQEFFIKGHGEIYLEIGGVVLLNWTRSYESLDAPAIYLEEGELYPALLLIRNTGRGSDIIFEYRDDLGGISAVPSHRLLHPSNHTITEMSDDLDKADIELRMTDWTGRVSEITKTSVVIDDDGPLIDVTNVPAWTRDRTPLIGLNITDQNGVGVEKGSIVYRSGEMIGENWTYPDSMEELSDGIFRITFEPKIPKNGQTLVQIEASDLFGNKKRSPVLQLQHDGKPPEIDLLGISSMYATGSGLVSIDLEMKDIGGCGVDAGSFSISLVDENGDSIVIDSLDMEPGNGSLRSYLETVVPAGKYDLLISVSDVLGNRGYENLSFTVEKPAENRPPIPLIKSPGNGSSIIHGYSLILDATGTKDDGLGDFEKVKLSWFSSIDGYIGSGGKLNYKPSLGKHTITLYADDGSDGHNVSKSVVLKVIEPNHSEDRDGDDSNDKDQDTTTLFSLILMAACTIILIGGLFLFLYKRSKDMEMVRMPIDPIQVEE